MLHTKNPIASVPDYLDVLLKNANAVLIGRSKVDHGLVLIFGLLIFFFFWLFYI